MMAGIIHELDTRLMDLQETTPTVLVRLFVLAFHAYATRHCWQ